MTENRRSSPAFASPRLRVAVACASFILGACSNEPIAPVESDLVVIEAFLFAGEPVTEIRVTQTIPLSSADKTPVPINDATVRLVRDDVVYELVATGTDGYYEDPGNIQVNVGDRFRIEVSYQGTVASGETTVPPPPAGMALSSGIVYAPTFGGGRGRQRGGPGFNDPEQELAVTWSNPDRLLHFLVVESLDDTAEPIVPDQIRDRIGTRFRFVSMPTDDDAAPINALTLEFLGEHRVRLYRINTEYAQLYENRTQDSRDLNEPPSNILNGLGVFSAFASDSAFFTVLRR